MAKTRAEMYWSKDRKMWRKRVHIGGKTRDVWGATKDEVRTIVKEMERQIDAGLALDDKTTFAEFAKEWFAVKSANLRPKSAEVYKIALNNHIAPALGSLLLREIKPMHVEKLLADKADLSKSAQAKILFTVSQILRSALANGLIVRNPCDNIRAGGADAKPKKPLSKEQQKILVSAVHGTRAELFVMLCLYAGLRREEALGLLWESVILDTTPHILVRHTVTFDQSRPVHSDTLKTTAARRDIPIPNALATALRSVRETAASAFVVPSVQSGGAMSLSAFNRMWDIVTGYDNVVKDKHGVIVRDSTGNALKKRVPGVVDFYVAPHLLRHTYITMLCASGMDIKKIQYLAGHEDVKMTLKVYAHVMDNRPSELSGAINNVFSG